MKKEIRQLLKCIDSGQLDWNDLFMVTDSFIEKLTDSTVPVYTPFGSFYVVRLPRKFKACMYVIYSEKDFYWIIESIKLDKNKKPIHIPAKKTVKIIAWLMGYNCLQFRNSEPFEEFALEPKEPKMFAILEPPGGWDEIYKELADEDFQADDDIADLDAFMKENGNEN